ncbi:hypothetical protein Tco_1081890 [Tanacetum coccineum]|uniref:Uncharacterized protein n=1 Tax=Tanacetum coccineum TaxID=301880 RepID=A0ABQ5I0C1_9ASTR
MDHFVPLFTLSTFPLILLHKPQNQWSHADRRLANQDKRLKSILISCLPNDVMKSVIKCTTAKAIWTDLILAHEGPSETKDTKIEALRLKFNAFKTLEGERVKGTFNRLKCLLNDLENNGISISQAELNATFDSDSDIEEDQRSSSEFLADLNAEFHERSLLANQRRFYKRSGRGKSEKGLVAESFEWDEESVSSDDEGVTTFKALMAITDEELSVGRADARSGQLVKITMKKVQKLLSITNSDERRHVLDYTHVDLHYVEDQRKNLLSKFNSLKQEFSSCMSELTYLKNTKAQNIPFKMRSPN